MFDRRRLQLFVGIVVTFLLFGIIFLGYFCPDMVCPLSPGRPTPGYLSMGPTRSRYVARSKHFQAGRGTNIKKFEETVIKRSYNVDIEGQDVIVFLHMQKTGGTTLGKHLVKNLDLEHPCKCQRRRKRCECRNAQKNVWLFSRYSVGWQCGLHADWTELKSCVHEQLNKLEGKERKRRYFYITILRDPLNRYLSEWRHVQRGSTWLGARLKCNGREASLDEVPFCFQEETWEGVTLDEFMSCTSNLAHNRQTRMLADLRLVGCYNKSHMSKELRDKTLLASAKKNLQNMAFFGLTEFQKATQIMFENTFHLQFIEDFEQRNITHASQVKLTAAQHRKILQINQLDFQLYAFAKELFALRYKRILQDLQTDNTNVPKRTGSLETQQKVSGKEEKKRPPRR